MGIFQWQSIRVFIEDQGIQFCFWKSSRLIYQILLHISSDMIIATQFSCKCSIVYYNFESYIYKSKVKISKIKYIIFFINYENN